MRFLTLQQLTLTAIFVEIAVAVQFFTNSTAPTNLTSACTSALTSDVNCSPFVTSLRNGLYYANTALQRTCTANCDSALLSYNALITTACNGETWLGYENTTLPVVMISDLLWYQYNLTCLMDSDRYCNNVAASSAAALDPSRAISPATACTVL